MHNISSLLHKPRKYRKMLTLGFIDIENGNIIVFIVDKCFSKPFCSSDIISIIDNELFPGWILW